MNNNLGKVAAGGVVSVLAVAVAFVRPWEGRSHGPYEDIVGVLTVCDGHTGADIQQRTYTDAECDQLLGEDLAKAHGAVKRCIRAPMTINQEAALTSATYNVGPAIVCGSTLARLANAGDWAGACAQLDRWVYAGGQRVNGLVRRRAAERALCEKE